ncbi:MAG TPA: NIPSNAP family protein [Tepidisphaeraceae bacterium]
MVVVRDIFQLKFGQAKEAVTLWKQVIAINQRRGYGTAATRMLTDLVGPAYYTLILETTFDSVAQFEKGIKEVLADPEWRAIYAKIIPLTESGRREILSVVA